MTERSQLEIKIQKEIETLKLENEKLSLELRDARLPYLIRNASLLTTLIATVGILVGLYVTTKKDYSEMILKAGEQASKNAAVEKQKADRELSAAELARREAMQQKSEATAYSEKIREQIAAEHELLAATIRDTEGASEDLKAAKLDLFKTSFLPQYIYSQQGQISALAAKTGRTIFDYQWLSSRTLRQFSLILQDEGGTLNSIPTSVRELGVTTFKQRVDLRRVPNPRGLTRLLIEDFSNSKQVLELLGLSALRNLEELSVLSYAGQVKGLDGLSSLSHLKHLSVTARHVDVLSPLVLNRLTSLRLLYDREGPLRESDFRLIGRSRTLRELIIRAQVNSSHLRTMLHAPQLESLAIQGAVPEMADRSDVFPHITTV